MSRRMLALAAVAVSAAVAGATFSSLRAAPEGVTPFVQNLPRAMTRVVFFSKTGLSGEYVIQYGRPAWKDAYDAKFEEMSRGKRLRLGKDWWTTLDSYVPLRFAGKTELSEGSWFLALDCSEKGEWSLVALNPTDIFKSRTDAFSTAKTTGGIAIPLTYEAVETSEPELKIEFLAVKEKPEEQTLEIRFGKHRLTVAVEPKL